MSVCTATMQVLAAACAPACYVLLLMSLSTLCSQTGAHLVVRPNRPEVLGCAQADHEIGHALLLELSHCVRRAHRDCQHHHCCALHPHGFCCSTGCHSCRKSIIHKHYNLACTCVGPRQH